MTHKLLLSSLIALAAVMAPQSQAAATAPVAKPKQYIYMLRVVPRLQDESKWTGAEQAATDQHFERLKKATASGQVILAGRSMETLNKTFGVVIFEAENDAAAKAFMESDPAVVAGVMTATLHPYAVALQRK